MDLLGSLKKQAGGAGPTPGLPPRLPGAKPTGDDASASFASFLPAAKAAATVPDDTPDLPAEGASLASSVPVTPTSVPRAPRKLVRTGTDHSETGTDPLKTSPSTSSPSPAVSASATPAKSPVRVVQARSADTSAPATTTATVPASVQNALPPPPPPAGNNLTSDNTDLEPDTVLVSLPIVGQVAASSLGSAGPTSTPAFSTAQNGSVPVSSPSFAADQNGSVPLSPALPSVGPNVAVSVSDPASPVPEPELAADGSVPLLASSATSSPRRMAAVKGSVPVSTATQPVESVPISGSVPSSEAVLGPVPVSTADQAAVPKGSVPIRARSSAVSAAYRTTARRSEDVAPTAADDDAAVASSSGVSAGANIAAEPTTTDFATALPKSRSDKNSLDTGQKEVVEVVDRAGTGVANSSTVPTNFSSNDRSPTLAVAAVAPRATTRDGGVASVGHTLSAVSGSTAASFNAVSASADRSAAAVNARDAVATVIKLAEAQQTRSEANTGSVNLGFKFGDDHLGVRVELRSGQVHTQFTTSSPELREALTTQFVALTGGGSGSNSSTDRPYQFAQPEFTGTGSSTDQRGSRQNEPQAPAEFALEGSAPSRSAGASVDPAVAAVPAASSALSVSALRLHAFA